MKKTIFLLLVVLNLFTLCINAVPVSLIWQADREKSWEEDWLLELLDGVDVNVIDDGKYKKYVDNSIIVISAWQKFNDCRAYFQKLHKMKYKFGIILLGDERYNSPTDIYKYASFVFRNYWHKDFVNQKKVSIFPLGYKKGYWKDGYQSLKPASERNFTWCFAGQVNKKPEREVMIATLKVFPNSFIHETFAWGDPNALDAITYRNVLLDSVFAPSPIGWVNLDSFRLYESLECGCIPIVQKGKDEYFAHYFGNFPFLAVDSWDEAPQMIQSLASNPDLLEDKRLKCYDWWINHKKMLNSHWIQTINAAFQKR